MTKTDERNGVVRLEDADGRTVEWERRGSPARAGGVKVCRADGIELRAGDRIRRTRNDVGLGFANSRLAEVAGMDGGTVTFRLEDGRRIALERGDPQLRHLGRTWASTVHAFQGRTVDHVVVAMKSSHPHLTTQKSFHVEISRARDSADLVTDDAGRLKEQLQAATGERIAALEAIRGGDKGIAGYGWGRASAILISRIICVYNLDSTQTPKRSRRPRMRSIFRRPAPCPVASVRHGRRRLSAALFAVVLPGLAAAPPAATAEVNLYSYRQPFLIEPILEKFTEETGIEVNVVFANKGMIDRIRAAGPNNPADAILTVDIGRLDGLVGAGLLEPVESPVLEANIPAPLRHPDGLWFGLTTRARVVFAHRIRVGKDEIANTSDLADPRFRGRVCSRSGKHVYNIAYLAAIIAREGEEAAEKWLRGVKANLVRKPQGNDRAQAKAIYEGVCDIALGNTYYMGKMATNEKKPEQQDWARAVRVQFLDQGRGDPGQHVNISGAGVIRGAKNREDAVRLIEFLSGDIAQEMYASSNFEYPVKPGVTTDPLIEGLGAFRADPLPLSEIARHRRTASRIVDRVGFEEGPPG